MDTQETIQSKFMGSLEMLEQVIVKCPAALWNAPGDQDKYLEKVKTSNRIG